MALLFSGCGSEIPFYSAPQEDDVLLFSEDHSEVLGFYSNGSIYGAVQIPPVGSSYLKIFRPRNRAWTTPTLARTIITSSSAFRSRFPQGERLQIGDVGNEHGGLIGYHKSHQNGLDADIVYLRVNHSEYDPDIWGEQGYSETFVRNGKVTKNFDFKRNWFLLREFVSRGNVGRIFVDAEIKRAFCKLSTKLDPSLSDEVRTETLRRLRPYPNHDDHFHVRIQCPENSPKCIAQTEPPEGTGCSTIDQVFFDEHDGMDGIED
jgi:penicillin-insensitive murein DD-endopeptidase